MVIDEEDQQYKPKSNVGPKRKPKKGKKANKEET